MIPMSRITSSTTTKLITGGSSRFLSRQSGKCLSSPLSSSSFSTSSSSPSPWVTIEHLEDDERIAMVKLQRAPANALCLEFCQEISEAIRKLEHESSTTTTMILSSGLPNKIFSAGLDISTELYQPDSDRLPEFWKSFQQVFLDLYGSTTLTTIAALEGPSPAGGCMLALSCDYRIADASLASKVAIGLNESHLGIVAPPWMCQQYTDVLGHRQAELALISGRLFNPQEALKMGLVDELVGREENTTTTTNDDDDDSETTATTTTTTTSSTAAATTAVERAAIARAKELVRIPQDAKAAVKELTRMPLIKSLIEDRETDVDFFCNFVTSDNVQVAIGRYLEALATGKKKKK